MTIIYYFYQMTFADSIHHPLEDGEGYDWYLVKQIPILNGDPGYSGGWAGSWQKEDCEYWWVGQESMALYAGVLIAKTNPERGFRIYLNF